MQAVLNPVDTYVPTAADTALLGRLFPDWVVVRCDNHLRCELVSASLTTFFGHSLTALARRPYEYFLSLIHPDDADAYRRVQSRIEEVVKTTEPAEVPRYRFGTSYRLRRNGGGYRHVSEEKLFFYADRNRLENYTLFKDVSERPFGRVQLDIFRLQESGYRRLNSYAPSAPEHELTARELEIMALIRDGLSSKEIAECLNISINTVRNHRSNLFRKTHARNVVDLITNTAPTPEATP